MLKDSKFVREFFTEQRQSDFCCAALSHIKFDAAANQFLRRFEIHAKSHALQPANCSDLSPVLPQIRRLADDVAVVKLWHEFIKTFVELQPVKNMQVLPTYLGCGGFTEEKILRRSFIVRFGSKLSDLLNLCPLGGAVPLCCANTEPFMNDIQQNGDAFFEQKASVMGTRRPYDA